MSDDAQPKSQIESVTRWKVRCYSCGWLPDHGAREDAEAEKRRHERGDCGNAEVKRVEATLHPREIWSDTTAADLGVEKL